MAKKTGPFFPAPASTTAPFHQKQRASSSSLRTAEQTEVEQTIGQHVLIPQTVSFQDIPLERIRPNPFQARQDVGTQESEEDIKELAQSIREHGFISVLFVRPDPSEEGYFQLAYGERRWRAAREVEQLRAVPCRVAVYTDDQMEDIGLIENMQRKALNPIDEALALQKKLGRIDLKTGKRFSIRSLADHLGVKKHRVEEPLRLCEIPPDVQAMVRKRSDTVRVAFEIAKLPTAELRQPLINLVLEKEANTKDIIYLVEQTRALLHPSHSATQTHPVHPPLVSAEQEAAPLSRHPDAHKQQMSPHPFEEGQREKNPGEVSGYPDTSSGETAKKSVPSASPSAEVQKLLREKDVAKDAKSIYAIMRRWSQWIEAETHEKALLHHHITQWLTELHILEEHSRPSYGPDSEK